MAIEQKRIEAAARALMSDWGTIDTPTEREREYAIEKVTFVIASAFPELFSDPPTGWVAPMEPTEAMQAAMDDCDGHTVYDSNAPGETHYRAARDAHTKEQT